MSGHVYKIIEVVGSSKEGYEDAIAGAIAQAAESLHHLRWFEVSEMRGHIDNGKVSHYQVVLKVGFNADQHIA